MKKVLALVLFAAIIAAIIWLLIHFKGFGGLGKDSDKGEGKNDTSVSEVVEKKETTTSEEATEEKSEVINISVSKNEYVYDNKVTSLEDLVKIISEKDRPRDGLFFGKSAIFLQLFPPSRLKNRKNGV